MLRCVTAGISLPFTTLPVTWRRPWGQGPCRLVLQEAPAHPDRVGAEPSRAFSWRVAWASSQVVACSEPSPSSVSPTLLSSPSQAPGRLCPRALRALTPACPTRLRWPMVCPRKNRRPSASSSNMFPGPSTNPSSPWSWTNSFDIRCKYYPSATAGAGLGWKGWMCG